MKVLQIHNKYRQFGGEDAVFQNEFKLLLNNGFQVKQVVFENDTVKVANLFHNKDAYELIVRVITDFKPDVVHVHNIFYNASPSVLKAAKKMKIPVVMTLHNYRLICPGALFLRNDKICLKCKNLSFPYHGIKNKCFHDSYIKSGFLAGFLGVNNFLNTWNKNIDRIIVLTPFIKNLMLSSALNFPSEKLIVKSNSTNDTLSENINNNRNGFLFIGRLSHEKGVNLLVDAFNLMPDYSLDIIGDGDLFQYLKNKAGNNIVFHGRKQKSFIEMKLRESKALIFPSVWFEGLPNTIIESFSSGTPVLVSNVDNINQIVESGYNGSVFDLNIKSLISKVKEFNNLNTSKYNLNARKTYESKYTHELNFQRLKSIYMDMKKL